MRDNRKLEARQFALFQQRIPIYSCQTDHIGKTGQAALLFPETYETGSTSNFRPATALTRTRAPAGTLAEAVASQISPRTST